MESNPKTQLSLLLFSLISLSLSSISASNNSPTVYQILPKFSLPSGLLPDSVQSYSLSSDGSFVVELDKPCYIQFDYLVYYDKKITGMLKYGSITDLKGIKVRRFWVWFDVDEIRVDLPTSDSIYFQVGLITKKLEVNQFKTVRSCGDKAKMLGGESWQRLFELPTPTDEVQMLITE